MAKKTMMGNQFETLMKKFQSPEATQLFGAMSAGQGFGQARASSAEWARQREMERVEKQMRDQMYRDNRGDRAEDMRYRNNNARTSQSNWQVGQGNWQAEQAAKQAENEQAQINLIDQRLIDKPKADAMAEYYNQNSANTAQTMKNDNYVTDAWNNKYYPEGHPQAGERVHPLSQKTNSSGKGGLTAAQIAGNTKINQNRGLILNMPVPEQYMEAAGNNLGQARRLWLRDVATSPTDRGRKNPNYDPKMSQLLSAAMNVAVGGDQDREAFMESLGWPNAKPTNPKEADLRQQAEYAIGAGADPEAVRLELEAQGIFE